MALPTRHHIAASTLNRAALYAAGLGLSDKDWRMLTPRNGEAASGVFHILPGASDELTTLARRNGVKSKQPALFDHTAT